MSETETMTVETESVEYEIITVSGTEFEPGEKEVLFTYDYLSDVITLDTTMMPEYREAVKKGWKLIKQRRFTDGTICGGIFEAPKGALTIRSIDTMGKKKLTEEHKQKMQDARKAKKVPRS